MLICWATRMSPARVEIAIPTQIDHEASNGVKITWARMSGPRMNAEATARIREQRDKGEEHAEHEIGRRDRGDEHRERLAEQELLAPDRRVEHRLERALLAFADHRIGRERRRHERRDPEHVESACPTR